MQPTLARCAQPWRSRGWRCSGYPCDDRGNAVSSMGVDDGETPIRPSRHRCQCAIPHRRQPFCAPADTQFKPEHSSLQMARDERRWHECLKRSSQAQASRAVDLNNLATTACGRCDRLLSKAARTAAADAAITLLDCPCVAPGHAMGLIETCGWGGGGVRPTSRSVTGEAPRQ